MKSFLFSICLIVGTATSCLAAQSQTNPLGQPDDLRAVLEIMRSDLNAYKIQTINEVMELTGPEADVFWPIYRQYEKELAAVGDRKLALIREFAQLRAAGTIDQKTWNTLSTRWLKNVQDRLSLWKKYQKKISKAVSPMRAAQFLQVEHQIALLIDLNVAAEMPTLDASRMAK